MIRAIVQKIKESIDDISSFEPVYPEIVFGKDKRKFRRKVERKLKGKRNTDLNNTL